MLHNFGLYKRPLPYSTCCTTQLAIYSTTSAAMIDLRSINTKYNQPVALSTIQK